MSNKTSRNLQLAAVILFGIALLFAIVSVFMQVPIKKLYQQDQAVLAITSIPWPALITTAFRLILSIVCLIVIAKKPSRGGAIALVIVSAVLLVLSGAVIEPALSTGLTALIARKGADSLTSYTALNAAVSNISGIISVPAGMLALLSLGGCIPKKQ